MIVVIQCAASKDRDAGYFAAPDGRSIIFVADPELAPEDSSYIYARPDDHINDDATWRELVLSYNKTNSNPQGLFPAYRLYKNLAYGRLVDRFGLKNVYILSAGSGLIRASFLTPYYDITFSKASNVEPYKRGGKADHYEDFCMLPNDLDEPITFFGGKDYIPLFCTLTESAKGLRTVFYNSARPPDTPGCTLERFDTTTRTNWHYECANQFLNQRNS
jgi:hypothetical protein